MSDDYHSPINQALRDRDNLWWKEIEKYLPQLAVMSFAGPECTIRWLFEHVEIKPSPAFQAAAEIEAQTPITVGRSNELAGFVQKITEDTFGTGEYKEGWQQGEGYVANDPLGRIPVLWTTIECSQCQNQVYFDKIMYRHRCCECGYGF